MPRRPVRRKDRAVSPVIATIILVAVAIVMAIAVAYWALGLGGTFTRYEKIEIMSMYATKKVSDSSTYWTVNATLKNSGSATATISMILIAGRPIPDDKVQNYVQYYEEGGNWTNGLPPSLSPGKSYKIGILLDDNLKEDLGGDIVFSSGMSIEVTFHTAAGSDYPKVVVLP
jgi:flagellin-like protein